MATTQLTQARIRALRTRKTTRDIRDAGLKGFGLRIYPSGRKRYFIHTQVDGKRIWKIVGEAAVGFLIIAAPDSRIDLRRPGRVVSPSAGFFGWRCLLFPSRGFP